MKLVTYGCVPAIACVLAGPAPAQDADPAAIVDLQLAIGGNHKKVRASGAKGVCVKGSFSPTPEAAGLSKAPQFAKSVPVTARFSMGGSNPAVSDKAKATTRGFAMRFADPAGDLALVFISAPVFGTRTPQQLIEFITVRSPGADGSPADPEKIKAFTAANPETTRQAAWLNARPVPASFAGVDYWGVQPYTLTDGAGRQTVAKLKAVAAAGSLGLTDDELKAKPDSFYADELKDRLATRPASFDLVAILREEGDPLDDATAAWPEDKRRTVKLGTVTIAAMEASAACDERTFDPVIEAPEGISGPVNDPMFAIRSPAYAVSLTRRSQ